MLPAIDELLQTNSIGKKDLELIVACTGPGSYTGLRVGVSLAKALAFGLGISAVGVPRLLADAVRWLSRHETVCSVHRAGRRDVALAVYGRGEPPIEVVAPRLAPLAEMIGALSGATAVVGEVPAELIEELHGQGRKVVQGVAGQRRPLDVARLGLSALQVGDSGNPQELLPVYLRPAVQEPAGA